MIQKLQAYVDTHRQRLLDELKAFLRIPSISTLPEHRADCYKAAGFVAESLKAAGLENVRIIETEGNPLVYADWLHADGKPTVLCYGHYDVQPPDPIEEWITPPFEPAVRDGNIYARGASDDKGQMYIHIKAAEALLKLHGELPVNLRFLIEGEEEVSGKSIANYVKQHKEDLKADAALISDTEMWAEGLPTLCTGLRGLLYMEVHLKGAARDLHSGLYGGVAPNPLYGLVELLHRARDYEGTIRVPGVYQDVAAPVPEELESWQQLPFDEEAFRKNEIGTEELIGEPGYSILERLWARPSFEIHGIVGGFTGAGSKTVIPARASAKVSFRLVPQQDPQKIEQLFREFVEANVPRGLKASIEVLGAAPPVLIDPSHPALQVASASLEEVFGKKTVLIRSGGSIPIVAEFQAALGIPSILMGFGLPDDGLHAPNEKFKLDNFYNGIVAVANFLLKYGSAQQA